MLDALAAECGQLSVEDWLFGVDDFGVVVDGVVAEGVVLVCVEPLLAVDVAVAGFVAVEL